MQQKKIVLLICDGMADRPDKEHNNKTPLEVANKPNMDKIAKEGICGLMNPIGYGIPPGSDTAHLALLSYDPYKYYTGRGPFEALGAGLNLGKDDIAFRCNFATAEKKNDKLFITDRRAGRGEFGLEKLGDMLNFQIEDVKAIFKTSSGHRGVLVLRGKNLSEKISDSDPHSEGEIKNVVPLDNTNSSKRTAEILNKFTRKAYEILNNSEIQKERLNKGMPPANIVLARGAGKIGEIPKFNEKYGMNGVCIAGVNLVKGISRAVGLDVAEINGATGHKDSNIGSKIDACIKELKGDKHDFILINIKGTDEISHDGDFKGKVEMIERIDTVLAKLLEEDLDATIALTADHTTSVTVREHSGDPVPVAILGDVRTDEVYKFSERECAKGGLGVIKGSDLLNILMDLSERGKKFGA
ncbi:MAG: phosphoglycerate mutase [Candidatus Altiarchaeales archaeon HGW-Altiarchaeales-1]|nr:MAG: phosphoglycerate mutase [Candidatus Altiarchaeales archaeon HGW-Altiarchaeales-1]